MNVKIKKKLAGGALALSLGALALGVSGISPALAEVGSGAPEAPVVLNQGIDEAIIEGTSSETTISASTDTLPWCGWYLSGVTTSLALQPDVETDYDGTAIELSAEDTGLSVFVGGSSTHSILENNCSWYGDTNKQEVWVSVAVSSVEFDAEVGEGTGDISMDFDLDNTNPLNINVVPTSCATEVFTVDESASIFSPGSLQSYPVKSNIESAVDTTDKCDWSVDYVTSIPGGLVPLIGGATYTFVGPLLTTTLEVQ